ncbi:PIG-L family deacetylase [Nonlabens ulvanivorans]|uniref:PIG-L family deacetylase n=4 Tax=Nonlabens ulvanivorans TaxID=906888 RepID=UPI0032670B7F
MKKLIFTFIASLLFLGHATAQENRLFPTQPNTSEIYHNLEKLGFLGTALYIAAHPDDENTRLISWLSNDKMARTGYLSLTRGDGGQNLIGPELREQLGMIRTQELLEARHRDGGEQFFTRANDFGYSKHPDETLEIWNQQEVLEDMVQIIRTFKPDVIINRFNHRTPGTTHGHHTTSAMLSMTAYKSAALKTAYASQLSRLDTWQPQRIFFNTSWWFYGSQEAFEKADKTNLLEIDAGTYYPWNGLSNSEIAALSRSEHKSQGFGSSGSRGSQTEYLEYLEGSFPTDKSDLFSGINTTWTRVSGGSKIQTQLNKILSSYDFKNPEASLPALAELHQAISRLKDEHWKAIKLRELEDIILQISGIYLEASSNQQYITDGATTPINIEVTNRSNDEINITLMANNMIALDQSQINTTSNSSTIVKGTLTIPQYFQPTSPYYLNEPASLGMYTVKAMNERGLPELESPFAVKAVVTIQNIKIYKDLKIQFKSTDPVRGEIHEPLNVVPAVSVSVQNPVYIFNEESKIIQVSMTANTDLKAGTIELCAPNDWMIKPSKIEFDAMTSGTVRTYNFNIVPPKRASRGVVSGLVKIGNQSFSKEVISIDYNHIPDQQLVRNNEAQVVKPNLKNRATTVAYINGAGDDVATAIEAIGSKVFRFEPSEVPSDLSKYDAVVVGIRAFNVAPTEMAALQERIDTYVKNGGTLMMQYNTSRRINPDALGPLSITLSRKRVTDENAAVILLEPNHAILNKPNKITSVDFENWVQERGLYFPEKWDPAFTPILGMNDNGEEMTNGSLIVARYGNGHIIYTGLSLFRELPAGVSGAYKLLANMVSIGVDDQPVKKNSDEKF